VRELIRRRLEGTRPADPSEWRVPGLGGDIPRLLRTLRPGRIVPAAVLIPVVDRGDEPGLLFTVRSDQLKHHAGQVSFPGGRLEPGDAGPEAAALRETQEEIGLPAERIRIAGFLPNYLTITGYSVTPVVAFVDPDAELVADTTEVAEIFEAPLAHVLDPRNIHKRSKRFMGLRLPYYEIPWQSYNIWGATAAMLVGLRDTLYPEDE
jgi:8-oxo-dGTP pyrophosphatase MutT (NUDIX family)